MNQRVTQIQERIRQAAVLCGRNPDSIQLVAVTKTVPPATIRQAMDAGLRIFGESYLQEAAAKINAIADNRLSWHFIGHLQSNKAKFAVCCFDLIHSVDSASLAEALNRQAGRIHKIQNVLVQVNISGESTKSGTSIKETAALVYAIREMKNLSVKGLMTIPPFFDQPEKARPYFKALADLKEEIQKQSRSGNEMTELSMGMTGDFEVAIEEGATLVRIGTAIFGERA
ncbi:MAG: YggS family pyridoxal phosphate-dependent enzyme [Desulfobacteraceae bacterium]|nr:YggS family pyridoxal phosphate-dependent enzyme [Desulfobacteraceae bacterium]